jgi:hypothetical protein
VTEGILKSKNEGYKKGPFGESYEMEFPKSADMKPPEGYYALLEEPCLN